MHHHAKSFYLVAMCTGVIFDNMSIDRAWLKLIYSPPDSRPEPWWIFWKSYGGRSGMRGKSYIVICSPCEQSTRRRCISISGVDEGSSIEDMASTLLMSACEMRKLCHNIGKPTSDQAVNQVSIVHYERVLWNIGHDPA